MKHGNTVTRNPQQVDTLSVHDEQDSRYPTVSCNPDLHKRAKLRATEEEITLIAFVERALESELAKPMVKR